MLFSANKIRTVSLIFEVRDIGASDIWTLSMQNGFARSDAATPDGRQKFPVPNDRDQATRAVIARLGALWAVAAGAKSTNDFRKKCVPLRADRDSG